MAFHTSDVSWYVVHIGRESAARSEDPHSRGGIAEYAYGHGISIIVFRLLLAFGGLESFYACHDVLLSCLKMDEGYVPI